jgi:hypothetical protein
MCTIGVSIYIQGCNDKNYGKQGFTTMPKVPIVIIILGIEGSGHHMINAYLKAAGAMFYTYKPSLTREVTFDFKEEFMKNITSRPYTIVTQASFPGGRPIHSENHPSISTIQTLPIDLRLVRLFRHPPDAVCSAYRRFGKRESDIILYSRIAEDSLAILNQYYPYEIILFDKAVRNQTYVMEKLSKSLVGTSIVLKPVPLHKPSRYDCPHKEWVENYFKQ